MQNTGKFVKTEVTPYTPSFTPLTTQDASSVNQGVGIGTYHLSDESLTAKAGGNAILGSKAGKVVRKSKSLRTDNVRFIEARCAGLGLMNRLHLIVREVSRLKVLLATSLSPQQMAQYKNELTALMVALRSVNRSLKKVDVLLLKLSAKIEAAIAKIITKVTALHQTQEQKAAEKAAKVEAARKAKEAKAEAARKVKEAKAEAARKVKEAKAEEARRAKAAKVEATRKAKADKAEEARKAKLIKVEEARKAKAAKSAEAREARKAKRSAKKAVKPVKAS
jgi:chromosome segregation ATPase